MSTAEQMAQKNYRQWYPSTRHKAKLPDLTEEEKARPFSKYYYEPIPEPDPAHMTMMDTPCDPENAIYPEQLNDLLNPGDLDVEIGWCNLPKGAGFIANRIVHRDATAEMVDWRFAWHGLEDLRYCIWYPPQNAGIMLSPDNRKRILDDTIPFRDFLPRIYKDFGKRMEV